MTITEILDKLFEKLDKPLMGENYLTYLDTKRDLEEVMGNQREDFDNEEIDSLEQQVSDLENEVDDLKDSCNCECVKCKKCVDK